MMAGLIEGKSAVVFCGAVIVSPFNAVSAAHCFSRKVASNLQLLVGEHDYGTGIEFFPNKEHNLFLILKTLPRSRYTLVKTISITKYPYSSIVQCHD